MEFICGYLHNGFSIILIPLSSEYYFKYTAVFLRMPKKAESHYPLDCTRRNDASMPQIRMCMGTTWWATRTRCGRSRCIRCSRECCRAARTRLCDCGQCPPATERSLSRRRCTQCSTRTRASSTCVRRAWRSCSPTRARSSSFRSPTASSCSSTLRRGSRFCASDLRVRNRRVPAHIY